MKSEARKAPRFSKRTIVEAAGRLTDSFVEKVGIGHLQSHGISFNEVYEHVLYPQFGTEIVEDEELGNDAAGKPLLGYYNAEENVAYVAPWLKDDPRRTFTLFHEVAGHGALHRNWMLKQQMRIARVTDESLSPHTTAEVERQANVLAAHLAAPEWFVKWVVSKSLSGRAIYPYTGPCRYYLTVEQFHVHKFVANYNHLCQWMASLIRRYFGGLSAEALGYRLAEIGIVERRVQDRSMSFSEDELMSCLSN